MRDFHFHVRRAVKIVGGQTKLAKAIGCAQSEVWRLCNTAEKLLPETALAIVRATDGEVLLGDLLPEIVDAVRAELAREPSSEVAA